MVSAPVKDLEALLFEQIEAYATNQNADTWQSLVKFIHREISGRPLRKYLESGDLNDGEGTYASGEAEG